MATNFIDNDYTINFVNTVKDEYSVSTVSYSEVTSSGPVTSSFYFSTQSMNTYNEQPEESSEAYVFFGRSVAIVNSSKILIGAPHKNHTGHFGSPGDVGSVFEYTYTEGVTGSNGSQWVQTAEISGNLSLMDTQKRMHFGTALAATGSYVAVGAPGLDGEPGNQAQNNGAVFIFRSSSSGYVEEDMFRPQDTGSSAQYFGSVLAFDRNSNRLAVNGQDMEEVYIFNSNSSGWQRETIITASANLYSQQYADFGHSLSLSGAYLAVGAPLDRPISYINVGSIVVYKSSSLGWSEIALISSSNPVGSGYFGLSLSMFSNKRIAIGEPNSRPGDNKTGSVEIVSFDDSGNYNRIQLIKNPREANYGSFGRNVSAYENGEFVVVSRPLSNDNGTNNSISDHRGDDLATFEENRALFVYELSGSDNWNLSGTLTRDIDLATYYDNNPGDWFYTDAFAKTGFHVPLQAKDGVILLGVEDASDNNFRGSTPYNYSFGEFRTWRTETSSSVTSSVVSAGVSSSPRDFVPFRFAQRGTFTIRLQDTGSAYKTFSGDESL
jgi:hypothetical protein